MLYERREGERIQGLPPQMPSDNEFRVVVAINALILLVGAALAVQWLIEKAIVLQRTPMAYIISMVLTIVIAVVCYCIREIKEWRRWYIRPPIEFGISMGLAAAAVRPEVHPVLFFISLMAAARVAIDAIKRFREFRAEAFEQAKAASTE